MPAEELPVRLPDTVEFTLTGQSSLNLNTEWTRTTCPVCGGEAERDTDTMDTFVDSSWYMYRDLSPRDDAHPFDPAKANLLPVDLYTGGIEHATLHLLYSRFWTKVTRDMEIVNQSDPFRWLQNKGMILGPDGEEMSKSRGDVGNPDDLIRGYGVGAVRTSLMSIAPCEDGGRWDPSDIQGPARWLSHVRRLYVKEHPVAPLQQITEQELRYAVHSTLKKISANYERIEFSTIYASLNMLTDTVASCAVHPPTRGRWTF